MRSTTKLGLLVALLGVGACGADIDFGGSCIMGSCGSGYNTASETIIVGFPADRVDRSVAALDGAYRGIVSVSDTVRFAAVTRLVHDPSSTAADTLRHVVWAVSNPAVAGIVAGPRGEGIFVARGAGAVRLSVGGQHPAVWTCVGNGCVRISEIQVVP